ncbi:MAG: transcriptional regulator [Burkholderiaceae bacterium]
MENADFLIKLSRLKEQLGLHTDKDVASALGLQAKAFNARKRRGAFPDSEVLTLKHQKPELNLDVDYIFTGIRSAVYDANIKLAETHPLIADVERLAGIYAMLSESSQRVLIDTARRLRELELLLKTELDKNEKD